jgi:hypothetical protein
MLCCPASKEETTLKQIVDPVSEDLSAVGKNSSVIMSDSGKP